MAFRTQSTQRGCHGNYTANKKESYLEPVALAVAERHVDNQDGEDEKNSVESAEVQVHGLVNHPPSQGDHGDDKQSNLRRCAQRVSDNGIHRGQKSRCQNGTICFDEQEVKRCEAR